MSIVGQVEKRTQARIVALLRDRLNYDYLGNWIDRADNRNIEPGYLPDWASRRAELQKSVLGAEDWTY